MLPCTPVTKFDPVATDAKNLKNPIEQDCLVLFHGFYRC